MARNAQPGGWLITEQLTVEALREGRGLRAEAARLHDQKARRSEFAQHGNPEVFAVSHLGWGLSRNSRWDALGFYDKKDIEGQDGRGHYGNFLFSTGPNLSGGGSRRAPLHLDIPLRDASVWLDDRQMVAVGEVLPAEQRI